MRVGGGTPAGAADAATWLLDRGADGLVSFGLAGGLDPALRPGHVVVPRAVILAGRSFLADAGLAARFGGFTDHVCLAGDAVVARASAKRALRDATGASAIDLESGAVAMIAGARSVPFAVVRAVCDPTERDLPPAALLALDKAGAIGLVRVLRSVLGDVGQVPALLALGRDAAVARRSLIGLCHRASR